MKVGDKVLVDYEGLGTIIEITTEHIAVKVDSDGIEVLCAFEQVHNPEPCEICGKGEEYCAFERGCTCWYGKPCGVANEN